MNMTGKRGRVQRLPRDADSALDRRLVEAAATCKRVVL
jgi:hypothetical protein